MEARITKYNEGGVLREKDTKSMVKESRRLKKMIKKGVVIVHMYC